MTGESIGNMCLFVEPLKQIQDNLSHGGMIGILCPVDANPSDMF